MIRSDDIQALHKRKKLILCNVNLGINVIIKSKSTDENKKIHILDSCFKFNLL